MDRFLNLFHRRSSPLIVSSPSEFRSLIINLPCVVTTLLILLNRLHLLYPLLIDFMKVKLLCMHKTVLILRLMRVRVVKITARFTIATVPLITFLVAIWTFARWLCLLCLCNNRLNVLDAAMELSLEFLQLRGITSDQSLLLLRISLINSACSGFQRLWLASRLRAQEVFFISVVTGKELLEIRITRFRLYSFLVRTKSCMIF